MGRRDAQAATVGANHWLKSLANLFGHRYRRVYLAQGRRVHVELRDVEQDCFERYAQALEEALIKLEGVEWVQINGHLARAVVSYRSALISPREIVGLIDGIEAHIELDQAPFSGARPEHPGDSEPVARKYVDILANTISVGAGIAMKARVFKSGRLANNLASLMSVVDNTPRLREVLDGVFNEEAVDVGFGAMNSIAQGIGSGPISPGIDIFFEGIKLRAERAQKSLWERREPALCRPDGDRRRTPVDPGERPRPLPPSPVDEYMDQAFYTSVGGFIVGLADTHNLKSAMPPLLGGLPKAARHGEDGFLAELIRVFSHRGILTLCPENLTRLDRVDTVVIDSALLFTGDYLVGSVELVGAANRAEVEEQVYRLFDPERPHHPQKIGEWELKISAQAPLRGDETQRLAPLDLSLAGELCARVQMRRATDPGAEQLLVGARRAGLTIVIVCEDLRAGSSLGPDEVRPYGDGIASVVRDLQHHGAAVALVAAGPSHAMEVADLAIGLSVGDDGPPWAADLLCSDNLDEAAFILESCELARSVAEQSVGLAGLGAAVATFLSMRGLKKTKPSHIMHAVNAVSVVALLNGIRHAQQLDSRPRPARRDRTPWHLLSVEEVLERLNSTQAGIDETLAAERRPEPDAPPGDLELVLRAIARELANPFTPILAAAAGISAVVGSIGDAAMVGAAMGLNGVIGGVERFKSEQVVQALETGEVEEVCVIRAGQKRSCSPEEVVVGDVLSLEAGDVLPADCRIIYSQDLRADESSLTGESLPVEKSAAPSFSAAIAERSSMLYQATSIAVGQARAVVVATGRDTEAHRGVLAGSGPPRPTGIEARLESLTDTTIPVAGLSGLFLLTSGLARNQNMDQLIDVGVGMSVAAVPEGLPLLATVAQLASARRLSGHGVLVRNPRAVEALGRVDVVCADKTGTLTEGKIELAMLSNGEESVPLDATNGESPAWQSALLAAALRASPQIEGEDPAQLPHPTDRAVIRGVKKARGDALNGFDYWRPIDERPFEPARGYHATLAQTDEGELLTLKGAPEVILPRCDRRHTSAGATPLDTSARRRLSRAAEDLAGQGLRVLAVAERPHPKTNGAELGDEHIDELIFRGFIGLRDPVRPTASRAVRKLQDAGVDVLMITGDHPRTARRIAQELKLLDGGSVLTGPELEEMSDEALDQALLDCTVVARATPAHKVRIVKALQRADKIVAMTGDGANDASAIRLADVGIALGSAATTAAREAADLIVVDERIDTIVRAVAEGRTMWRSVRDAVSILTGGNFGEIGFTLLTSLADRPPLNARQLLLVNLLTDIAPSLSLVMREPGEAELEAAVSAGPETQMGAELDRQIINRALTTGAGAGLAWMGSRLCFGGLGRASTVSLLALVGTQLSQTLIINRPTPQTTTAAIGSAALLLAIIETPGISHLFGCRPVGPVGLACAASSSALATGASLLIPPLWQKTRAAASEARQIWDYFGNTPQLPEFYPFRKDYRQDFEPAFSPSRAT